ncbi:MAG: DUF58 domain-containing protein [Flavobacteriales bacterium]|nr:DUF58 domain-containing protein [Flavobacteriales bacterium]
METSDLLKKVRKIEIKTKGLSNNIFSGGYHSAFKGKGMAFSEVREYMIGDPIRTIDWNVTARFNKPFVKVFEEERELTVILLVDLSASENFGSKTQTKKELIAELCAVLSFSAIQNNDKIGVIFFTDKVEKFIPPKKGKSHILAIIRELLNFKPTSRKTNIEAALKFLTTAMKKRTTAFIISDFISENFESALKIANTKHDVVALNIFDTFETELPDIGHVKLMDLETGKYNWVNTSSLAFRKQFKAEVLRRKGQLVEVFRRSGVDFADINIQRSYVKPLMNLFRKREMRR